MYTCDALTNYCCIFHCCQLLFLVHISSSWNFASQADPEYRGEVFFIYISGRVCVTHGDDMVDDVTCRLLWRHFSKLISQIEKHFDILFVGATMVPQVPPCGTHRVRLLKQIVIIRVTYFHLQRWLITILRLIKSSIDSKCNFHISTNLHICFTT